MSRIAAVFIYICSSLVCFSSFANEVLLLGGVSPEMVLSHDFKKSGAFMRDQPRPLYNGLSHRPDGSAIEVPAKEPTYVLLESFSSTEKDSLSIEFDLTNIFFVNVWYYEGSVARVMRAPYVLDLYHYDPSSLAVSRIRIPVRYSRRGLFQEIHAIATAATEGAAEALEEEAVMATAPMPAFYPPVEPAGHGRRGEWFASMMSVQSAGRGRGRTSSVSMMPVEPAGHGRRGEWFASMMSVQSAGRGRGRTGSVSMMSVQSAEHGRRGACPVSMARVKSAGHGRASTQSSCMGLPGSISPLK